MMVANHRDANQANRVHLGRIYSDWVALLAHLEDYATRFESIQVLQEKEGLNVRVSTSVGVQISRDYDKVRMETASLDKSPGDELIALQPFVGWRDDERLRSDVEYHLGNVIKEARELAELTHSSLESASIPDDDKH